MFDFFLIFSTLLIVLLPLTFQGYLVIREQNGYRKNPKYKDHPEMKGVRKGDRLLFANFSCK